MAELLGIRAYARRRGVNHSAVQKAIRAGRLQRAISRDEKGRVHIDAAIADEEWVQNTDRALQRGAQQTDGPELAELPSPLSGPADSSVDRHDAPPRSPRFTHLPGDGAPQAGGAPSYSQSRAVREAYNAKTARVRYELLVGSVVRAEEVRDQAFGVFRTVRDALLNVPHRVAAEIAATTSPHVVIQILNREFTAALAGLVDEGRRN